MDKLPKSLVGKWGYQKRCSILRKIEHLALMLADAWVPLWLDEHPDETCVVITLSQNAVIALLSPDNNVVSVQHIRDEYLDERLAIAFDMLRQGGDYSGAGLAGAIDNHPLAASTAVGGTISGRDRCGTVEHIDLAAKPHLQLPLEFGYRLPVNAGRAVVRFLASRTSHNQRYPD